MTVTIRETKPVTVETFVAALTIGSLEPFMRECAQAKLPQSTEVSIAARGAGVVISAESLTESDNLPQAAEPAP